MVRQLLMLCCALAAAFMCGAHETADGSSVGQNHARSGGDAAAVRGEIDPTGLSVESSVATPIEPGDYLKLIFNKYGKDGVINIEKFRDLLTNVHLSKLVFDAVTNAAAGSQPTGSTLSEVKTTSGNFVDSPARLTAASDSKSSEDPVSCVAAKEALRRFVIDPNDSSISREKFLELCPVILYEIDKGQCLDNHSQHVEPSGIEHVEQDTARWELSTFQKYAYSSLAVFIISITGMMSVAVVPIIQRFYYQQLLQYLVALAVGSLVGDALLHLLPHAMREVGKSSGGHSHSHEAAGGDGHEHNSAEIWLGLTALGGICLFFVAERALTALNAWKEQRAAKIATGKELRELKTASRDAYSYTYEGISELNKVDNGEKDFANYEQKRLDDGEAELNLSNAAEKSLLNVHDSRVAFIGHKPKAEGGHKNSYDDLPDQLNAKKQFDDLDDYPSSMMVVVSEHKSQHKSHGHTHSHSHSHSHAVPRTAMATAWMVIAGDGLHNFADGMAIGAAFAKSPTIGLSTAIAVFCHELPHELGDFALLIKAGMGIRQALFYNGLSSFLCFLGMVGGLMMVNIESANAWVFAGTAGMFLYIALVDMVPELNSETTDSGLVKFVLQALGIATGVTIMCLIAVYESELERYFGS